MSDQTTQQGELVQVRAYTFEQLAEDAQEKVKWWLLEDGSLFRDHARDDQEYYQELAAERGATIDKDSWQWDVDHGRASFVASVDVETFITTGKMGKDYQSLLRYIRQDGWPLTVDVKPANQYYGNKEMIAVDDGELEQEIEDYSKKALVQYLDIRATILNWAVGHARAFIKDLQAEEQAIWSDDYIADMCHANEWRFSETGKPIHHLIER